MGNWKDYFDIKEIDTSHEIDWELDMVKYHLIIKATGEVIAKYNDLKYAQKQAKFKYKKMSKKIERILLGN
jgi:hypothetical protein